MIRKKPPYSRQQSTQAKNSNSKPDPYAAAGIVMGMGHGYSLKDAAMLGCMLGAQGTFDNKEDL